jgi:2-dehydropantoate 2-reductase
VRFEADQLVASASELPAGAVEVALLATQNTEVEVAASAIIPALAPSARVICLQNGLAEPRVASVLAAHPASRAEVWGAVVTWGASVGSEQASVARTARGATTLGALRGRGGGRDRALVALGAALTSLGPVRFTDNLLGARWSKLAINCATTALGVVSGERLGRTLARRRCRRLALEVIGEAVAVARAEGVQVERVAGTLDLDWLARGVSRPGGFPGLWARHLVMLAVGARYRRLRSSMLAAIEQGRAPAIDYLNGEVVCRGRALGVSTPKNAALVELVWQVARGEIAPHPDHLRAV